MLRSLLHGRDVVRVLGVNDGFSARLGTLMGFDALWASGLGICAAQGLPDAGLLGISDYLAAATTMRRVTDLPIVADCDGGFGDVNAVRHMVRRYEEAGIDAICMEDKSLPKRNSFSSRQMLADPYEFAAKLIAAKAALRGSSTLVFARVEALVASAGEAEALARARLYQEAGADAIFIHSKAAMPDEVIGFASRWPARPEGAPLLVAPTTYPSVRVDELAGAGVAAVIYANQLLRATQRAVVRMLEALSAHGTSAGVEQDLASIEELFEVVGMSEVEMTDTWFARTVEELQHGDVAVEARLA